MPAFSSIALGIAAAASAAGGIAGAVSNMSAQDRAALLQDKGVQEWLKANIPDPEEQKLTLQRFVQQGTLTPKLEEATKQAESNFQQVAKDEGLNNRRLRALDALEQQGYGGEQVQDTAARQKAIIDSGAANRGRQEAVIGDLSRRGQLGGGLELAARMDASQAEGDRLASNSLGMEADRRTRALSAIASGADQAGQMSREDVSLKGQKASAQDAIDQFNARNLQGVQGRNTDRTNTANEYNLNLKQKVADQNVGTSNFEQQYNKELLQQQYDNQVKKAAGLSNQYNSQAQTEIQKGKAAADMWGNIASGVGAIGTAGAKALAPKTGTTTVDLQTDNDDDWAKYYA